MDQSQVSSQTCEGLYELVSTIKESKNDHSAVYKAIHKQTRMVTCIKRINLVKMRQRE